MPGDRAAAKEALQRGWAAHEAGDWRTAEHAYLEAVEYDPASPWGYYRLGVLAANYMATEAVRDGTVIASIAPAIITHQLLEGRGARYDIGKFHWLGASDFSNQVIYVWAGSGVTSLNDAMRREVVFGGTGAGSFSVLYPALMNALLGTRIKIVTGYKAAREIDLAMERGEVEGRAGNYLSSLRTFSSEWLAQKKRETWRGLVTT